MSDQATPQAICKLLQSTPLESERKLIDEVQSRQPEIDRLVIGYVTAAFRSLGLGRDDLITFADIDACRAKMSELGLPAAKVWWIQLLAEIALRGDETETDTEGLAARLHSELPFYDIELTIITRVGNNLSRLMQAEGTGEIVQTLFADDLMTRWYTDGVTYQIFNALARETTRLLVAQSADASMSVLEVGGGTGGLTSHILGEFNPNATRFQFTDVGAFFLRAGRRRFAQYPFVEFTTLDLERPCFDQDIADRSCHLVIANNVIHDTRNLKFTLQNLAQTLQPGGYLLMLELTDPQIWWHMCFGSLDGWWRFKSDPLDDREDLMLLKADQWKEVLTASGFSQAAILSDSIASDFANRLFLSQVD